MPKFRVSLDKIVRTAQFVIVEADTEDNAVKIAEQGGGDLETEESRPQTTIEVDHATEINEDGSEKW